MQPFGNDIMIYSINCFPLIGIRNDKQLIFVSKEKSNGTDLSKLVRQKIQAIKKL